MSSITMRLPVLTAGTSLYPTAAAALLQEEEEEEEVMIPSSAAASLGDGSSKITAGEFVKTGEEASASLPVLLPPDPPGTPNVAAVPQEKEANEEEAAIRSAVAASSHSSSHKEEMGSATSTKKKDNIAAAKACAVPTTRQSSTQPPLPPELQGLEDMVTSKTREKSTPSIPVVAVNPRDVSLRLLETDVLSKMGCRSRTPSIEKGGHHHPHQLLIIEESGHSSSSGGTASSSAGMRMVQVGAVACRGPDSEPTQSVAASSQLSAASVPEPPPAAAAGGGGIAAEDVRQEREFNKLAFGGDGGIDRVVAHQQQALYDAIPEAPHTSVSIDTDGDDDDDDDDVEWGIHEDSPPALTDASCRNVPASDSESASVVSTPGTPTTSPPPESPPELVQAELVEPDQTIVVTAKAVMRWRSKKGLAILALLLAFLVIIAVTVGVAANFAIDNEKAQLQDTYTTDNDEAVFRQTFEHDAQLLLDRLGARFDLTMRAADAFMIQVISQGRHDAKGLGWPHINVPDLPVQAAKLLSQTKSIHMAFYPFITADERLEWENFTKYNHDWVEESLQFQSRNPNFHGPIFTEYNISNVLWDNEGPLDYDCPGPFMPSWMGSPVIPTYYPYNWNSLAYEAFSKPLLAMLETKTVVFGPVANHADPSDPLSVAQAEITNIWAIPYLGEGEDSSEPFSDMYYPVIDLMADQQNDFDNQTDAARGSVAFSFYWRDYLENILADDSMDLTLVVHNACGDRYFTYELSESSEPLFLGFTDLQYDDDMVISSELANILNNANNNNGLVYTGLPPNADFCPYTWKVYPTNR